MALALKIRTGQSFVSLEDANVASSLLSCVGNYFQIRAGGFRDGFGVAGIDGGEIDKVATHAEGACAGLDKAFRGLQRHAAGGNELEMREGREQGFQIACPADSRAGKDLHVIGACVPRGDGFGGRERAGARDFFVGLGCVDHLRMQTGADDELRARVDGGLGLIGSGHGSGAEQKLRSVCSSSVP